MKILVRLPNWLGDMVMSVAFIHQLRHQYPDAEISVIAKKGIHHLLPFFPPTAHQFVFDKAEYKGIGGVIGFGKLIKKKNAFDLFFCLPDSFSSALMGWAVGAKKRVGYKKELRSILLTNAYEKPEGKHRVDEYLSLLQLFTNKEVAAPGVHLQHNFAKSDHIVVNINSEASSRRLTVSKAVDEISLLRAKTGNKIILVGAPKETVFVDEVFSGLANRNNIENLAGKTAMPALIELLATAQLMLTTDSGPAHLANALGTHTIVLFGAGNEANTAPYNRDLQTVIRLGKLSCEPCLRNECRLYQVPQCLQQLDVEQIINKSLQVLNKS